MEDLTTDLQGLTEPQERMRRDLRYHFMNPLEKWQAKGTLPIKFIILIIKVVFITCQLIVFSDNNVNQVTFFEGSKTSFRHLFLLNWDSSQETPSYPPSHGPFAVYTKEEYYNSLSHAVKQYYLLDKVAMGPYKYGDDNKPVAILCVKNYNVSTIFPFNQTYSYSKTITSKCINLGLNNGTDDEKYDVLTYLNDNNFIIDFNGLINSNLTLTLQSIQLQYLEYGFFPSYEFNVTIRYDNSNHNGQTIISLHTKVQRLKVHSHFKRLVWQLILDALCIIFSVISFFLCSRSAVRLYRFWKRTKQFFQIEMGANISNKWTYFFSISYVVMFLGDFCNFTGTILKLYLNWDDQNLKNRNLNHMVACSYFLGFGLFLGYCTILRYASYFPKSSILVNTIKVSFPPLIRFSLCSIILYMAFSLFGWIILGPYHIKFQTLQSSIACLFSLMNGDDMYVTLTIINEDNTAIVIFSQIYIYLFCILFVFVVLNLILTIIIEAYDHVKQRLYISNFSNDVFWNFINSCPETATSTKYRSDLQMENSRNHQYKTYLMRRFVDSVCCCFGKGGHVQELFVHQYHGNGNNCGNEHHAHHANENELSVSIFGNNRVMSSLFTHPNSPGPVDDCPVFNQRHTHNSTHRPSLANYNYGSEFERTEQNENPSSLVKCGRGFSV